MKNKTKFKMKHKTLLQICWDNSHRKYTITTYLVYIKILYIWKLLQEKLIYFAPFILSLILPKIYAKIVSNKFFIFCKFLFYKNFVNLKNFNILLFFALTFTLTLRGIHVVNFAQSKKLKTKKNKNGNFPRVSF